MTEFSLRIYAANGALEDTLDGFTQDGAAEHAAWEVNHHGAAKVEVVRASDGKVVGTVTPRV